MKICKNCNIHLEDDCNFCPECGQKFDSLNTENINNNLNEQNYQNNTNFQENTETQNNNFHENQQQNNIENNQNNNSLYSNQNLNNMNGNYNMQNNINNYNSQDFNNQNNFNNYNNFNNPYNNYNNTFNQPFISTTGLIIWSIFNLILCNTIFGVLSLVFTLNIKKSVNYDKAYSNFKTARTLCIVGTCLGFISNIFLLLFIM